MTDPIQFFRKEKPLKSKIVREEPIKVERQNLDFTDLKFKDAVRILKTDMYQFSNNINFWTEENDFTRKNGFIGADVYGINRDYPIIKQYFHDKYGIWLEIHQISTEDDVMRIWLDDNIKNKAFCLPIDFYFDIEKTDPNPKNDDFIEYIKALKKNASNPDFGTELDISKEDLKRGLKMVIQNCNKLLKKYQ